MTQQHIEFLYKYKVMHHNFVKSGVIPHLPRKDVETFFEIAKTFNPEYSASLWCGDCVMEMVDYVYRQAAKLQPVNSFDNPEKFTGIVEPIVSGEGIPGIVEVVKEQPRQKRKYEKRR